MESNSLLLDKQEQAPALHNYFYLLAYYLLLQVSLKESFLPYAGKYFSIGL